MSRRRARSLAATAAATALAVAVVPGVADAKRIVFGSDLTAPANRTETHGADSVFWNVGLAGGRKARVPARGRVATIKLKGTAIRNGKKPLTEFHFQILHPSDGRVRVSLTSGPFDVPVGGDPNQITTYHPVNLCARKRDFVAFNDEGGYDPPQYPQGTPFRVFSSVPGSTTRFYTKADGTNNGARFKGSKHVGEELLMQMTVVTGKAAGICPH
ncbi:MAG TPA: hypothetical protein VF545_06855 [Thermoleophilaceae bacterium]|jgi:hypothetical protein